MKLIYAKLWLRKYIRYNHDNLDENQLNRAIINLSHRVCKSHGQRGHNIRQSIRSSLVEYSKTELANYNVPFTKPLKVGYMHRQTKSPVREITRAIVRMLVFVIKIIALGVLLAIILEGITWVEHGYWLNQSELLENTGQIFLLLILIWFFFKLIPRAYISGGRSR